MKRLIASVLFAVLALARPDAYAGSNTHRHALGVGISLSPGWTATDSPEGIVILPTGVVIDPNITTNPEVYIAGKQDGFNPAGETEFVTAVSQTFLKGGGQLKRADRVSLGVGTAYYWEVYDPREQREGAFTLYLRPANQSAFVIVAIGLASRIRTRDTELRQMLASMDFQAPRIDAGGPLADSTPLAKQWLNKLSGRMIRQMWASQGMSSDKRHYLHADGTYAYKSSSMVAIDVGPYAGAPDASALSTGRGANTGRWRIRDLGGQVALQVQYTNGETRMFKITQDSRNWYLDGEKAFAIDPD